MDTSPPILSIIIPSHGRQVSLNALLNELYRQAISTNSTEDLEIIVVDDGTTPPLQALDNPVKTLWLRLNTNSGAPAARKLGFGQSSGKFIHFHDSDDSISEGWLTYLINKLQTSPDIDFLLSARKVLKESGQEFRTQQFIKKFQHRPDKIAYRLKFNNCFGPLGGLTFSRKAVQKMRFNDLKSCQDWDMCLDAIEDDSRIVCDDGIFFIKNESIHDRISSHLNKKFLGFMKLGRIHQTEIANCPPPITKLFYIHSIHKNFKHLNNTSISNFYKKRKLLILFSVFIIEVRKLAQHIHS